MGPRYELILIWNQLKDIDYVLAEVTSAYSDVRNA